MAATRTGQMEGDAGVFPDPSSASMSDPPRYLKVRWVVSGVAAGGTCASGPKALGRNRGAQKPAGSGRAGCHVPADVPGSPPARPSRPPGSPAAAPSPLSAATRSAHLSGRSSRIRLAGCVSILTSTVAQVGEGIHSVAPATRNDAVEHRSVPASAVASQERPVLPAHRYLCLLYTSPSPRDLSTSRMPSSA